MPWAASVKDVNLLSSLVRPGSPLVKGSTPPIKSCSLRFQSRHQSKNGKKKNTPWEILRQPPLPRHPLMPYYSVHMTFGGWPSCLRYCHLRRLGAALRLATAPVYFCIGSRLVQITLGGRCKRFSCCWALEDVSIMYATGCGDRICTRCRSAQASRLLLSEWLHYGTKLVTVLCGCVYLQ